MLVVAVTMCLSVYRSVCLSVRKHTRESPLSPAVTVVVSVEAIQRLQALVDATECRSSVVSPYVRLQVLLPDGRRLKAKTRVVIAKFHYTSPTGPNPTRPDKASGLCRRTGYPGAVGCGWARL